METRKPRQRRLKLVVLITALSLGVAMCLLVTVLTLVINRGYDRTLEQARGAGIPTSQDQMQASFAPVEENAADTYFAAFGFLDAPKPGKLPRDLPVLGEADLPEDPREPLAAAMLERMRAYLAERKTCLALLREARGQPLCRFTEELAGYQTPLPHLYEARESARLLMLAALVAAEEGDGDTAVEYARDSLALGRAIGQEPFLISQLVAMAVCAVAKHSLELTLAKAEANDAALLALQRDLESSARCAYFADSLKVEAGMFILFIQGLKAGDADAVETLRQTSDLERAPRRLLRLLPAVFFRYQVSEGAGNWVRCVRSASDETPEGLREAAAGNLYVEPGKAAPFAAAFFPDVPRAFVQKGNAYARMQSAAAAVAALRFVNAAGRLPASLEELVPAYVSKVPVDPWTGRPFVYKTFGDHVLIYSIGQNLVDDGGRPMALRTPAGEDEGLDDVGFCLWLQPLKEK